MERCWLVLLYAGSIIEMALELVRNRHIQQVLGLTEYWGKQWYV